MATQARCSKTLTAMRRSLLHKRSIFNPKCPFYRDPDQIIVVPIIFGLDTILHCPILALTRWKRDIRRLVALLKLITNLI